MKGLTEKRLPRRTYWVIYAIVFVVAVVVVAFGLTGNRESPAVEVYKPVAPELVSAQRTFGFNLFNELRSQGRDENIFISPASLALALTMTYNGAAGETRDAMASVLGIEGMSLDQVNAANAAVLANLDGPGPGVTLSVANSLWADEGATVLPDFMRANDDYYRAKLTTLDLQDPSTPATINAWVDKETRGRIPGIVRTIPDQAILVLINAVYFKGAWQEKFKRRDTKPRPFHLLDGTTVDVPMMHRDGEITYLADEKFQAVELPYGHGRLSMYVFLPDQRSSLDEFCRGLTAETWAEWMSGFGKESHGRIGLPRFKLEYEAREGLRDALTAMGMGIAFDADRADFAAMTPTKPVWIHEVAHKTFVDVNEEGTEAAAATEVMPIAGGRPGMIADRPFFCAIVDNKTGVILFMGAITDPR